VGPESLEGDGVAWSLEGDVGGCRRAGGLFDRWRAMGWGLEGFRGCREWLTMRLESLGKQANLLFKSI